MSSTEKPVLKRQKTAAVYDLKRLANLQVQSDWTLLPFSYLELHRVALVQVFNLIARGKTAAMEENVLAAVIGLDETEAFLANNLFDRAGHCFSPLRRGLLTFAGALSSVLS
jgi:hypothetical protein